MHLYIFVVVKPGRYRTLQYFIYGSRVYYT